MLAVNSRIAVGVLRKASSIAANPLVTRLPIAHSPAVQRIVAVNWKSFGSAALNEATLSNYVAISKKYQNVFIFKSLFWTRKKLQKELLKLSKILRRYMTALFYYLSFHLIADIYRVGRRVKGVSNCAI